MRTALLFSLGLCTALSNVVSAEREIHQPLTIRVYDRFGISRGQLDTARSTTREILRKAGLEPTWRTCSSIERSSFDCEETPVQPSELIVRIVATPIVSDSPNGPLGYSQVDTQARMGTLATVFGNRAEILAKAAGIESGSVLGLAIVHELGHLLMGNTLHSGQGPMQREWSLVALNRNLIAEWFFSRLEGEQMRRGLAARLQTAAQMLVTLTHSADTVVDTSK